jgi:hypothetical protein
VTRSGFRPRGGPRATGALLLFGLFLAAAGARAGEPEPTPAPSLAGHADRVWEGMARRRSGLVLLGRWRTGTLAFKGETIRWTDSRDPGWNLVLPAGQIRSHRRVCRDPADAATCFEWSFRTARGERFVFRDVVGKVSGSGKVSEIFDFVSAILPKIPAESASGAP